MRQRDTLVKGAGIHVQRMQKALTGNYREEHIFSLEQEFDLYKIYLKK